MNMKIDLKVKNKIKLSDLQIAVKKIPPILQSKTAQAAQETVHITYDQNYNGLSFVDIEPVNYTIDENIIPGNIRNGVNILGCEGNMQGATMIRDASYFFYMRSRWEDKNQYLPLLTQPYKADSMFNGIFSSNTNQDDIIDLRNIDFSQTSSIQSMFYNCGHGCFDNLLGIENLNLSSLGSSREMENLFSMFGTNRAAASFSEKDTLDLSNWVLPETSPSQMNYLFQSIYKNIPHDFTIDLSNWVLDNTTSMNGFFNNSAISKVILKDCELKPIDTLSLNTMFQFCNKLKEVDISSMCKNKIRGNISIQGMFNGCTSLEKIDMRNFRFDLVRDSSIYYNNCFKDVPDNCLIIVKDNESKTWVTTKYPNLVNVKTVAELEGE